MFARHVCGLSLLLLVAAVPCTAAKPHLSVDTGECGEDTPTHETVAKSAQFTDKAHSVSAYGVLSFRRLTGAKGGCRVVFQLFVAVQGKPFANVKRITRDAEDSEINGIDLIGTSPDGTKFAADFWWAEGDGEEHRPVVFDVSDRRATDLPLEDKIQNRIHGCDQNEYFVAVTNSGEAVFAIPPSIYDDSPECGDKGTWNFNLETGRVYRVAKLSGQKWR